MAHYPSAQSHDDQAAASLTNDTNNSDHDDVDDFANVHLATLEEKKRRWWRNAFINTMFIASWCERVLNASWAMFHVFVSFISGSSLPLYCRCTTSGCSRRNTSVSHSRCLSQQCTCSFSLRSLHWSGRYGPESSFQIILQAEETIRKYSVSTVRPGPSCRAYQGSAQIPRSRVRPKQY